MKDALGHGSEQRGGVHSTPINNLPAKMTKAHFQIIAQMLRDSAPGADASEEEKAGHMATVNAYAAKLATTNPGFNRQRFMDAVTSGKVKMPSRQSSFDNAKAQIMRVRQPRR
jgi:hypothetical protein